MWHMMWHTCGVNGTTKDNMNIITMFVMCYNIDDSLHVIFDVSLPLPIYIGGYLGIVRSK